MVIHIRCFQTLKINHSFIYGWCCLAQRYFNSNISQHGSAVYIGMVAVACIP